MAGPVQRSLVRSIITAVITAGALSVALAPAALAADHAVDIAGFAFSPPTITVSVGDTVTWTNADAQGHTATADDASFDTGTIAHNTSKSVTFDTAGTVAYHCRIHPSMTATILVAGGPPATDTAETRPQAAHEPAWALLVLAGLAGLDLARRRFGRRAVAATIDD